MKSDPKVIVALDYADPAAALAFVDKVTPEICKLKVGKELFTRAGPALVEQLVARQFDVFLDLKFHDIPNTVERACYAAAELGVWMLNVHAMGGRDMLVAAKNGVMKSKQQPLLIAVTVLTSLNASALAEIGVHGSVEGQVLRLATLTQVAGLDGVVCSAREVVTLREHLGDDILLVTPGIRPVDAEVGDQQRIMTPEQAIEAGSSYLVIGRPITQAPDPIAVLNKINHSLAGYLPTSL